VSASEKINTKSSTEAEVIGASDYIAHTLYVKMFMEAQGYPIEQAIFYQDNESAIKMERNGRTSCGQRSRHPLCFYHRSFSAPKHHHHYTILLPLFDRSHSYV
jgi:hypothetical protein